MRKIAVVPVLLVVAFATAGCVMIGVPVSSPPGSGGSGGPLGSATPRPGDAVCVNGVAQINQQNTTTRLTGYCPELNIHGHNVTVIALAVKHIQINGDNARVTATAVGGITIAGGGNVLRADTVGAVTINGDGNTVSAKGAIGAVNVSGSNNAVTSPTRLGAVTTNGEGNTTGKP